MVYRVAGLPVAIRASIGPSDPLRFGFARRYWHPGSLLNWAELVIAIALWPLALLLASIWFTARNGPVIRRRSGKSLGAQLREQFSLYFSHGIFGPWYYIFSLDDDGARRAGTFLQRFETKTCYFRVLKDSNGSPLNDKVRFAEHCRVRGIRCVETLMALDAAQPKHQLPDRDLFVKPIAGRGGRGAERWDRIGPGLKALALAAHRQFDDRVVIGWDIAVLEDGPILVEGNSNPEMDILQRFMRVGLREHRFAALVAHHLQCAGAFMTSH